jgi:predicted nucleotidyltransferase
MSESSAAPIKHQDKIIKIIEMFYPNAKIYLFGSYARGDALRGSDIDVAIDNGEPIDIVVKSQIRTMMEALNLVQRVDVVDFQSVPKALKENILKDRIIWKN